MTADAGELEARALAAEQREAGAVEQIKRLFARVAELEGQLSIPRPALPKQSVMAVIRQALDEREAKGVATYGDTLRTFGGRDSLQDELEEFLDGFAYRIQAKLERAQLEARLRQVEAYLHQAMALLSEARPHWDWGGSIFLDWLRRRDAFLGSRAAMDTVWVDSTSRGG